MHFDGHRYYIPGGFTMRRIFVPTRTPSDWQMLLAQPQLHWKKSYSAMTAAACWEASNGDLPPEIIRTFELSGQNALLRLKMLAVIPEWEVELPGGQRSSHTDVLALTRNDDGVTVICVEAKVNEPFGPTLGQKRREASPGQTERLDYLHSVLELKTPMDDGIRYQLLHRSVSAIKTAQDFHASAAVMLVHSFSLESRWREDFTAFCEGMSARSLTPDLYFVPRSENPCLYLAWCAGDAKFTNVELPSKFN
jgi:hypothetical protein